MYIKERKKKIYIYEERERALEITSRFC